MPSALVLRFPCPGAPVPSPPAERWREPLARRQDRIREGRAFLFEKEIRIAQLIVHIRYLDILCRSAHRLLQGFLTATSKFLS
jgi:hypothetical protein